MMITINYITTNKLNGKQYVGMHSAEKKPGSVGTIKKINIV